MSDVAKVKQIGLFKGIDEKTLKPFASLFREEQFSDGEVIFKENDTGEDVYFILSGEVQILKSVSQKDGVSQMLAALARGDFFGEMALFDQNKRSATAKAKGAVAVLVLKCKDFYSFLGGDILVTINILGGMLAETTRRLRETDIGFVTLYETGQLLASGQSVERLLKAVLDKVREMIPSAERGLVVLWNEFSEMFELRASSGHDVKEIVLKKDDCVVKWVKENKKVLTVEDAGTSSVFKKDLLPSYCGSSFILQPFIHRKELLGFLLLASNACTVKVSRHQINLLSGIAGQIAPAIANAKKITEEENRRRLEQFRARR